MRRVVIVSWFSALAGVGLVVPACTTDHDSLAQRPRAGTGGSSGGSAGSAAEDSGPIPDAMGTIDGRLEGAAGSAGTGGGGPDGPDVLTLVNGVVDAPAALFCVRRVDDTGLGPLVGDPFPAGGLDYAGALVVESLVGVDFASDSFLLEVVVGELARVNGLDCEAALDLVRSVASVGPEAGVDPRDADTDASAEGGGDAAVDFDASEDAPDDAASETGTTEGGTADVVSPPEPAPLRSHRLPIVPRGTLSGGKSFLLVATGCVGGPGITGSADTLACGVGYGPSSPTLQPVLVTMSRQRMDGRLGLQVANASANADRIEARNRTTTGNEIAITTGVVNGSIGPNPPQLDFPVTSYGDPIGSAFVDVYASGSVVAQISPTWESILERGGIGQVQNGRTYTLVLVGPRPGLGAGAWWNDPAVTLVANDPDVP